MTVEVDSAFFYNPACLALVTCVYIDWVRRFESGVLECIVSSGCSVSSSSTFMGIAIHNLSASGDGTEEVVNLTTAVQQTAAGILGTTVQMADLVRTMHTCAACYI